ncbi:MAG: hypothetical protein RI996_383 [Candidatus Parcubacteria bacterium]|jgi:small subunit ribosomal protein S4
MPRITSKQSRRLGLNLSGREKDGFVKRPYPPGILDSQRKHKSNRTEFGSQLKAKQIVRISYGLREKQFSGYVLKAMDSKDKTTTPAERVFKTLESRLDNVVYRSGLAHVRALARQIVAHGHITVNGKRVLSASYQVKPGDIVGIREGSKKSALFTHSHDKLKGYKTPAWMKLDSDKLQITITGTATEIEPIFDLASVIEFYSR